MKFLSGLGFLRSKSECTSRPRYPSPTLLSLCPQSSIIKAARNIIQYRLINYGKHSIIMSSLINSQQNGSVLIQEINQTGQQEHPDQVLKQKVRKCVVCRKGCNYECPKCKNNYCSVSHYRSHNLFCTQQFYKQQVEDKLKSIKVSDKKEKMKAVQLVKQHQQLMYQEQNMQNITPQRLMEILSDLEQGKQPTLSSNQSQLFQQYAQKISKNQQSFTECPQFWEVQEGLSLYIQQQPSIQEFNQSEHPNLILYRLSLSQRIRDIRNNQTSFQHKVNPKISYHIYQIVYLSTLLHRVFDAQTHSQFISIFLSTYYSEQNEKVIKQNQNINCVVMVSIIHKQLLSLHTDHGLHNIIHNWVNNSTIITLDTNSILKNNYLILELMFRLIDALKANKESKDKRRVKLMKKLQFLCELVIIKGYEGKKLVDEGIQANNYLKEVQKEQTNIEIK